MACASSVCSINVFLHHRIIQNIKPANTLNFVILCSMPINTNSRNSFATQKITTKVSVYSNVLR